jgi:hypothetical protein
MDSASADDAPEDSQESRQKQNNDVWNMFIASPHPSFLCCYFYTWALSLSFLGPSAVPLDGVSLTLA